MKDVLELFLFPSKRVEGATKTPVLVESESWETVNNIRSLDIWGSSQGAWISQCSSALKKEEGFISTQESLSGFLKSQKGRKLQGALR